MKTHSLEKICRQVLVYRKESLLLLRTADGRILKLLAGFQMALSRKHTLEALRAALKGCVRTNLYMIAVQLAEPFFDTRVDELGVLNSIGCLEVECLPREAQRCA